MNKYEAVAAASAPQLTSQISGNKHKLAAIEWHQFGLSVIPLIPQSKKTAVKWDPWLEGLSQEKIAAHWAAYPDHEVGFIVPDGIIVLDADSPQSMAALAQLEQAFGISPNMVIKTNKGVHHYYLLAAGAFAKTDSHSTQDHPERIDVKARRSMVILPPSTGKEIEFCDAQTAAELMVVSQEFIDAIFRHNGRDTPRPHVEKQTAPFPSPIPSDRTVAEIDAMLSCLDPDMGYEDWTHVGMAIAHETSGSDEGFAVFNAWSSRGRKYPGKRVLRAKWASFQADVARPVTIATIRKLINDAGHDWVTICSAAEPGFEECGDTEVVHASPSAVDAVAKPSGKANPLDRFSLLGKSAELEKNAVAEVFVLGEIALKGQATAIYAAPNTGKTLLTFRLLTQAIVAGHIIPANLYYLNMDDTGSGLREKVQLAEEYGFHVLAEGHADFQISSFISMVNEMIQNDQCRDVIIVLDTLKKFTNLMDKGLSSSFAKVIRRFVIKGGTLIALAHTNKNPGKNGKLTYGGTTDIVDDFDCAYTLAMVSNDQNVKVVEFDNFKRRGNVAPTAAYSYSTERGISYSEILVSVRPVDSMQLLPIKQAEDIKSDGEVIAAITACITEGVNTKMKLIEAVSDRTGISRKSALNIVEKYSGNDPAQHRWRFEIRERGAKVFVLLQPAGTGEAGHD